jgi:hypothetical protein
MRCRPLPFLGQFAAPAANAAGACVLADLYAVEREGDVVPAADIEEAAWVDRQRLALSAGTADTRLRPAPSALGVTRPANQERMAHAPAAALGRLRWPPHPCYRPSSRRQPRLEKSGNAGMLSADRGPQQR